MRRALALGAFLCGLPLQGATSDGEAQGAAVLERRCLQCHGPATQMGELDLSSRDAALKGGTRGPALAPTDPSESLLLSRVAADEMPPGSPLSSADKETLREWIAGGAAWPERIEERRAGADWWSLQPLRDPLPPRPRTGSRTWMASPVDRWVLAGLETAGLRPAPEARPRDLIRRVSFALRGLPPEPEEVDAFLKDASPDAYEGLLDRLLASPHYGERWARHWLDLVRFAESEGFERDLPRYYAWPYRDYVIRSLNDDKSYLQFAREQMAGDAMEPSTRDSVAATTMLTLGPVDAVGLTSAIPEERASIREDMLEEMLGTVTQTFLGLTVNCARCHDHKFDPIPQEEYYRMKAAFQAVWPPTRPVPSRGLDVLFPYGSPLLTPEEKRSRGARRGSIESRLEAVGAELGDLYRGARPPETFANAPVPLARWTFDTDVRADFAPLHLQLVGKAETREGKLRRQTVAEDTPGNPVPIEEDGPDGGPGFGVSRTISEEIRAKTLEAWLDVQAVPEQAETVMEIRGLSGYRGASVDGIRFVPGDNPRWENSSVGRFRSKDTGGTPEKLESGARVHVAIAYAADGMITVFRNGTVYGEPYKPDSGIPAGRLQVYRADDALVRFPASEHLHVAEARLYDVTLSATRSRACPSWNAMAGLSFATVSSTSSVMRSRPPAWMSSSDRARPARSAVQPCPARPPVPTLLTGCLQDLFGEEARRLHRRVAGEERSDVAPRPRLLPALEPVADPVRRADEGHVIDELVGDRGRRFRPAAGEEVVLDLDRRRFVPEPLGVVVVEVLRARPHAADVEGEVLAHHPARALEVVVQHHLDEGGDLERFEALPVPGPCEALVERAFEEVEALRVHPHREDAVRHLRARAKPVLGEGAGEDAKVGVAVQDAPERLAESGGAFALIRDLVVLALVSQRLLAGEDLPDDRNVFAGAGERAAVGDAVPPLDDLRSARPHPEDEPPARHRIEGHRGHRRAGRRPGPHLDDRRADVDARSPGEDPRGGGSPHPSPTPPTSTPSRSRGSPLRG